MKMMGTAAVKLPYYMMYYNNFTLTLFLINFVVQLVLGLPEIFLNNLNTSVVCHQVSLHLHLRRLILA